MKKITKIVLGLIILLGTIKSSCATELLSKIKGSDLVNAAKMVLDDSFTPPTAIEQLHSMYALGFIEGVLACDIQKKVTNDQHKETFELGKDGEIEVLKLILEYVEGSITLEAAEAPPLLHALLCIRYGSSPEIRSNGVKVLSGLSAKEAKEIIEKLKKAREIKAEQAAPSNR
jgi:hypothetical protein